MNPRTTNSDLNPNNLQPETPNYDNVSFGFVSATVFDLQVQVISYRLSDLIVPFKTQTWELKDIFMAPTAQWQEIVEALQVAEHGPEWPIAPAHIHRVSNSTANVTVGDYHHFVTILSAKKPKCA